MQVAMQGKGSAKDEETKTEASTARKHLRDGGQQKHSLNDWIRIWIVDVPVFIVTIISMHAVAGTVGVWDAYPFHAFIAYLLLICNQPACDPRVFPPGHVMRWSPCAAASAIIFSLLHFVFNSSKFRVAQIIFKFLRFLLGVFVTSLLPFGYVHKHNLWEAAKKLRTMAIMLGPITANIGLIFVDDFFLVCSFLLILGWSVGISLVIELKYNSDIPLLQRKLTTIIFTAGGISIITLVIAFAFASFHSLLGAYYFPIFGYMLVQVLTNISVMVWFQLIEMLADRPRKHLVQVLMLPLQFFLELAVSIVFVDANPLVSPIQFTLLILMVIIVDLAVETGGAHAFYYRSFKKDQSVTGLAVYLAKKHQFLKQKRLAEPVATVSILIMTLVEHFSAGRVSLLSANSQARIGTMIGYGILIMVELILGRISQRELKKRMGRIRENVSMELKRLQTHSNQVSLSIGGQKEEKVEIGDVFSSRHPLSPHASAIQASEDIISFEADSKVGSKRIKSSMNASKSSHSLQKSSSKFVRKCLAMSVKHTHGGVKIDKKFIEMYPILNTRSEFQKENDIFEDGSIHRIFFVVAAGSAIFPALLMADILRS